MFRRRCPADTGTFTVTDHAGGAGRGQHYRSRRGSRGRAVGGYHAGPESHRAGKDREAGVCTRRQRRPDRQRHGRWTKEARCGWGRSRAWFASSTGISPRIRCAMGWPGDPVVALAAAPDGSLWAGTASNRLVQIRQGQTRFWRRSVCPARDRRVAGRSRRRSMGFVCSAWDCAALSRQAGLLRSGAAGCPATGAPKR